MTAGAMIPIVIGLLIGLVLVASAKSSALSPGREMARRFATVSPVRGRTYAEIVAVCGRETSRSAAGSDILLQWIAPGFHVALLFGPDRVCKGMTHHHDATR